MSVGKTVPGIRRIPDTEAISGIVDVPDAAIGLHAKIRLVVSIIVGWNRMSVWTAVTGINHVPKAEAVACEIDLPIAPCSLYSDKALAVPNAFVN